MAPPPITGRRKKRNVRRAKLRARRILEVAVMSNTRGLTRRKLLSNLGKAAGACLLPTRLVAMPGLFSKANTLEEIPLRGKRETIAWKIQPFPMTQVRLRPGPFQETMETNRSYIHS